MAEEQYPPTEMWIPAVTSLAAPAAAVLASQASSSTTRLSLRPSTPPALLISSTASWAPFFMYGPIAASEPLSGVSMPSLMSPAAEPPPPEPDVEERLPPPQAVRPSTVTAAAARAARRSERVISVPRFLPARAPAVVPRTGRVPGPSSRRRPEGLVAP